MKKIGITIILSFFLITACFDDKSTQISEEITPVEITVSEFGESNSVVEVQVGVPLTVNPEIKQVGVSQPDLSYEWKLSLSPDRNDFVVLSNEMNINAPIIRQPSTMFYYLWLTVTDNTNELQYNNYWRVRVISSAGDGVIVADTEDGIHSDISLIRSRALSSGYTGETFYKRHSYSAANGEKIKGLVKQLQYGVTHISMVPKQKIYVLTQDDFFALSPETYKLTEPYEELFINPPATRKPYKFSYGINEHMFYSDNGNLYYIFYNSNSITGSKFVSPLNYVRPGSSQTKYTVNDHFVAFGSGEHPTLTAYDEVLGRFICITGGLFSMFRLRDVEYNASALNSFDPNNEPNLISIASGPLANGRNAHLMKNKNTSEIALYTMEHVLIDYSSVVRSVSKFPTNACPEINNALFFEMCENRDVMYYATPSKVYSASISGSNLTSEVRFTPPEGEEITAIKLFREAWYEINPTNSNITPMDENTNQLLVATYNANSKEGKLYALDVTSFTGTLSAPASEKTFTGFNKITAIGTQGK